MADPSQLLILDALRHAVAEPAGLPLLSSKTAPGLFASTGPGKTAAQECKNEGLVHVVRTETRGKVVAEICTLTEKGLARLLEEANPKQVIHELVQALEARQNETCELLRLAAQMQNNLEALKATAVKVLQQVGQPSVGSIPTVSSNGNDIWIGLCLSFLAERQQSNACDDCPLPILFRHACQSTPRLTIGHFHDGLRQLHDQERIYLHPWTGPLYDLPEPALALLVGHEIAFYASLRK